MRVIKDYKTCPPAAKGSVVALGNFDGVHKGHEAVIGKAREVAASYGVQSAVLTFEPHPVSILKNDVKPFRLTSEAQKINIIEKLGIDNLFVVNFTQALSEMKSVTFIQEILMSALEVRHIVTGEDFIFGHKREGDSKFLEMAAEEYGFGYSRVVPVGGSEGAFSSTLIRKYLASGNLKQARQVLGRNFIISGIVQDGKKNGRKIGFPTINVDMEEFLRPAFGVYAAILHIEGRSGTLIGAANIGIRPTLGGDKEVLEMHVFDFSEDIYGFNVEIELVEYIRPEQKFANFEELSRQISHDCDNVREILS